MLLRGLRCATNELRNAKSLVIDDLDFRMQMYQCLSKIGWIIDFGGGVERHADEVLTVSGREN